MNLNTSNPAIRRILSEVKKLESEPSSEFEAHPVEDNLFDWHFVLRGSQDTPFAGGLFHGRIILPAQGRFEVGKKICLSISQHHPELWQPGWDIRTALTAIQSFMPSPGSGAIAALDYSDEERRKLAQKSLENSKNSLRVCNMLDSFQKILTSDPPASSSSGAAAAGAGAAREDASMRESKVEKASQPISKPDPATPKTFKVPTAAATSASAAATPAAKFGIEKTDSSTTAPAASPSTNSDADDPHGLRRRKTSSTAASASSNATTSTTSPTPTPAAAPAEAAAGTNSQAGGSNGVGCASRPTYAPASYAPHAARAAGGADANGAAIARAASRRTQVGRRGLVTAYPDVDWGQEAVTIFRHVCAVIDTFLHNGASW